MSILLTGGTGQAALAIAAQLSAQKLPFLLTSRRGPAAAPPGMAAVTFDWHDPSTFTPIFTQQFIRGVVLVVPPGNDVATPVNPFIDLAKKHGVKRFVLVTGGSVTLGGPWAGQVYSHLELTGVTYSVLRLNWFNENFLLPMHVRSIRESSTIYSGSGIGRAPHTALSDVAEVAVTALTSEEPLPNDLAICGPEHVSYDDVARAISKAIGKEVKHVSMAKEENEERLRREGWTEWDVALWGRLEEGTRTGKVAEFHPVGESEVLMENWLGRRPLTFEEWAEKNKEAWM